MDSLDLGTGVAPVTQSATTDDSLALKAPEPVTAAKAQQAADTLVVPDEAKTALESKAAQYADTLASLDPQSPEFTQQIQAITTMGAKEAQATAEVSNRMLQRPAMDATDGNTPQVKVGKTLGELRSQVTELDPNRADLTRAKKMLKWLPGGNKIDAYFNRYRSAQDHLDAITKALKSGQDELRKDNASIEVERAAMYEAMGLLKQYSELAQAVDVALEKKIAALRQQGQTETATALESDALFRVRQRHQDLQTQMAVTAQGFLALDVVRKNNDELATGVERALTTTMSALRTAVIVSQALTNQELILAQIEGLNQTTGNLIVNTAERLKQQGARAHEQAASSTVSVDQLKAAFQNVFDTMDAIDTFRAEAAGSMKQTITDLSTQIERASGYVDHSARQSQAPQARMPWDQ